jgi:glycosyltransferase involved in cell wall biosynthesis
MSTDLPRDVVLFSTADWDYPFWTNKQHVALHLARRGFRVLYIESLGLRRPTASTRDLGRIARRVRRSVRSLRQVRENLWVGSPVAIPIHGSRLARWVNEKMLAAWVRRQCRRLGFSTRIVWTYNPLVQVIADSLDPLLIVYHAVDDLRAAPHMPALAIERAEHELVAKADLVFATSRALQARFRRDNSATYYLSNVVDYEHFARACEPGAVPTELAAIPHPRLGFVGAISEYKVDLPLIASVARARPDWHWVLIGQIGEGQPGTSIERLKLPNVHLLGPRDYERLPDYLRGLDVATIPACQNAYTAAMFPMKFFEYLAAELPVVVSGAPALTEFSRAFASASSPAEFIERVEKILGGARGDLDYARNLARRHTWEWRTNEMIGKLTEAWQKRAASRAQPDAVDHRQAG